MREDTTAFVLGGGGKWGAVQVGMLQALLAVGRRPDLIVGCSIGAINGAAFAEDPTPEGLARLQRRWCDGATTDALSTSRSDRARALVRLAPSVFDNTGFRALVERWLSARTFADLTISFSCVAASIEAATAHWFDSGDLVPALLASAAIPGLFPAVRIGDEHYFDGGLVNSIPVDRALALGATEVFVLQVGRTEQPLRVPRRLHESALVAFEIARRHRYVEALASVPSGTSVHVLPSGHRLEFDDARQLRWRDLDDAGALIDSARVASAEYLEQVMS